MREIVIPHSIPPPETLFPPGRAGTRGQGVGGNTVCINRINRINRILPSFYRVPLLFVYDLWSPRENCIGNAFFFTKNCSSCHQNITTKWAKLFRFLGFWGKLLSVGKKNTSRTLEKMSSNRQPVFFLDYIQFCSTPHIPGCHHLSLKTFFF